MFEDWDADARKWAGDVFSGSALPDERLNDRLIAYGAAQALEPSSSTAQACKGDRAAREGAYRFLENPRVLAEDIDEGPFHHTAERCQDRDVILAIQDTSSVSVRSNLLREQLKSTGSPTGFLVHSTLMVDGFTGAVIGLADQIRWTRGEKTEQAKSKESYECRESSKWEMADRNMAERLDRLDHVVVVADRESDIYEFIEYMDTAKRRFVLRAQTNRRTSAALGGIFAQVGESPVLASREIVIEQRGAVPKGVLVSGRSNRERRTVETSIQAVTVTLQPPKHLNGHCNPLVVNVVRVSAPGDQDLEWFLLTREPIASESDLHRIVQWYEMRWTIEEFHKCWKTGCRLESRPLESLAAVEKIMAITAPIAVRMLQLSTSARSEVIDKTTPSPLNREEIACLWALTERTVLADDETPSKAWALSAIAKLGGWYDSKKTGRVSWTTLWNGWESFQHNLVGWRAACRAAAVTKM